MNVLTMATVKLFFDDIPMENICIYSENLINRFFRIMVYIHLNNTAITMDVSELVVVVLLAQNSSFLVNFCTIVENSVKIDAFFPQIILSLKKKTLQAFSL